MGRGAGPRSLEIDTMQITDIIQLRSDSAVRFAARELRRVLQAATGSDARIRKRRKYRPAGGPAIWLGLFEDFPEQIPPDFTDDATDDAVVVRMGAEGGLIAGSNPRSVLLGVYRYLTQLGCRWVRPGKNGERIPQLDGALPNVDIAEKASCRHRGICIEGAVSYEHVRDLVDWLAKLGFNEYFIQFREGHHFFHRWYAHDANPRMAARPLSRESL